VGELPDTWNYSGKSSSMKYRQLTRDERYMIVQLRRERCGLSEMARLMGRARSTIWRELKRNMIPTRLLREQGAGAAQWSLAAEPPWFQLQRGGLCPGSSAVAGAVESGTNRWNAGAFERTQEENGVRVEFCE
jgi:hypothetical protein